MDELLSFLYDEMAIEGERGLTLAALQTAIETHDEERAKRTNSPPQHLDYAYRNFVWRSMRRRPEVRVGRFLPAAEVQAQRDAAAATTAKGKKSTAGKSASTMPMPGTPAAGDATMDVDENEEQEEVEGAKGKGKGKAKNKKGGKESRGGIKDNSFAIDSIAHDEVAKTLDLNALHEQYGDELRFGLDEATLRFKLTGNHNAAFLPEVQYAALQLIMRARGNAIPSVDLGAALGVDNRTMYYINDCLIEKGLIIKFRGQFGKSAPNACVATRFKEQCPAYMQLQALDRLKEGTRKDADDGDDDDDDETGDAPPAEGQSSTGGVSAAAAKSKPILMDAAEFEGEEEDEDEEASQTLPVGVSTTPVSSDVMNGMLAYPPCSKDEVEGLLRDGMLVRARLIKLLQMSNNNIVLRRNIGRRLGLPAESKPIAKAVSRIIKNMLLAEHVRFVRVNRPSANDDDHTEKCIQLLDAGTEWAAEYAQTTLEKSQAATKRYLEAQLRRYETPRIAREVPIERQITEIICNSGSKGVTIADIAERLGATTTARRSIIQCIEKLSTANIFAFDDAGITELRDSEGRTRHIRYYSRLSFQRMYKDVDLPGYENVAEKAVFRDPKALYDFPVLPHEQSWTDRADLVKKLGEQSSKKRKAPSSAPSTSKSASKKARVSQLDPLTGEPLRGRPRKYPGSKEEARAASAKAARERKKLATMTPEEVEAYKAQEAEREAARKAKEDAKAEKAAAKAQRAAAKASKAATPKGPRGRPRKENADELTPAARRYREKVDKARAEAAAAAAAAGEEADDDDDDEEEEDELSDAPSEDEAEAGPGPGTAAAAAAAATAATASPSPSLAGTPAPGAKRRGRPRKPVEEMTPSALKRRERLDRIAAEKAATAAAEAAAAAAAASSSKAGASNYRASSSRDSADVLDALGLGEEDNGAAPPVASDEDELASPAPQVPAPAPSTQKATRARGDTAGSDSARPSKRTRLSAAKKAQAAPADDDSEDEDEDTGEKDKTPAPPQDESSDVDMEVVTPAPAAAPAARATPASVSTPATLGRKKAPKAPDSKPRVSIATSQRVALLRAFLEEEDTRIVDQANLAAQYRMFVERTKGAEMAESEVGDLHDTKVRNVVIDQLEQRGILKKTMCTAPYLNKSKLAPRQCVVLSHTSVPVAEVDEFVKALGQGKAPKRVTAPQAVAPNLGMAAMENIPESALFRRYRGSPFLSYTPDQLLDDPKHHDIIYDDMITRSQLQGYLPGDIARLECFHLAVLELFDSPEQDDDEDGAEVISSKAVISPEEGILETESLAIDALPLRDLLRVVTSTPSESLRVVLADKEASAKPVAEQTPLILAEMNTPSTHEAIAEYLRQLELLRLIEPMVQAGKGKWARAEATKPGETAKYYRVQRSNVKVLGWNESFAYNEVNEPFNFTQPEERHQYWRQLYHAFAHLDLDKCSDEQVKTLCTAFRRTSANSKHYVVSRTQRFFLERFVDEAMSNNLLDNEERMMRISSTVVAPLWVTLRWFEAKCDKKLPSDHALKIKARATRKQQFGLSGEGDPTGINPVWSANEVARQARSAQRIRKQKWTETVKRVLTECDITDPTIERNIKSATYQLKKNYAEDPDSFALADLEKLIKTAVENHLADLRGEPRPKKGKASYKSPGQLKIEAAKAEKAKIREEMGPGRQRAPRSTYKWDRQKDEDLRDAVVILRARDKARGNKRQNWVALSQIFPSGNPPKERFKKLCNAIGEKAYLDQLEVEWTKWWIECRGTDALPDPDPLSPTNFDLLQHVRFLQDHVDKDKVLDTVERGEMDPLPATPADIAALMENYHFETPPVAPERMWDAILEDSKNISMIQRTNQLRNHAFTFPAIDSVVEADLTEGLAKAYVKMTVETDDKAWSSPVAEAIMATLGGDSVVTAACHALTEAKVIRRKQSDRRKPGNNFIYADGVFPTPFHDLDPTAMAKARAEVEKDGITAIPNLDDVHTAAIITLLSECRLEPEFDLTCIDKVKNAEMFNAKRLYDSDVEIDITFKSTASDRAPFKLTSTLPKLTPVLDWLAEEQEAEDEQLATRVDEAWAATIEANETPDFVRVQERLRELLTEAGKMGVLKDELKESLLATIEGVSMDTILEALEELSHASPPLVFSAGYDAPRLISAAFVKHWALHVASRDASDGAEPMELDDEAAQLDKYVFPRLWLDIYGNFSSEAWERSMHAVVRTVYLRPGITFTHLVRLLGPAHDRLEVLDLVNAACEAEMLQKQALPTADLARSHEPEWIARGDDVILLPPGVEWSPLALAH